MKNILVHQVADYYREIYQEDINHFGSNSPLGKEWALRLEKIDNIEFAADKGYTNAAEAIYQISKLYHG